MITNDYISLLEKLFLEKFKVTKEVIWENIDQPLSGRAFKMDAVDITYLFLEIQKLFYIEISYNELNNYQFLTIELILNMLKANGCSMKNSITQSNYVENESDVLYYANKQWKTNYKKSIP